MVTGVAVSNVRAAVGEVHAAMPVLRVELDTSAEPPMLRRRDDLRMTTHDLRHLRPDDAVRQAVTLLVAARDSATGTHVHVLSLPDGRTVLALAAHQAVLDERSLYLVLGAVVEACRGRFRPAVHPTLPELLAVDPLPATGWHARRAWWARWLDGIPTRSAPLPERTGERRRLLLPAAQLDALGAAGGMLGDHVALGVAALVVRLLDRPPRAGVSTVLDLRDYLGLGTVVGALTDRIVFRVDAAPPHPSFQQLARAAQVGLLRSVTHYLPYGELVELATRDGHVTLGRTAEPWDLHVHLCRNPSGVRRTRGTEPLGVDAAHFAETELLAIGGAAAGLAWDGTNVDLHLGDENGAMSVTVDVNSRCGRSVDDLVDRLTRTLAVAAADPTAPLTVDAYRKGVAP
ncbi:hypothetical protein [Micromonospora okii]|uniref:hypothetical protein n=1 Tax=Micromonospora okii TaxID=1182970 RepID=UPI001E42AA61|nr:hypothetical protein [Micromonospora okii]